MRSRWIHRHLFIEPSTSPVYECPDCGFFYHFEYYTCPNCGKQMLFPKKTNGDNIREMNNEELAKLLDSFICPPFICDKEDNEVCEECILEWLKQEVEE